MNERFITFEGLDGSGKSTQLARAADWLRGRGAEVVTTFEPGDTPLGGELRRLLLDDAYHPVPEAELLLFLADRAQHVAECIRPALARGAWVLCDRYSDSTFAYQFAGRALENEGLERLLSFAEATAEPALTLWFDLPPEEAAARMRRREAGGDRSTRLDREARAFHERVREGFRRRQAENSRRMRRIDAAGDIETVWARVRPLLEALA